MAAGVDKRKKLERLCCYTSRPLEVERESLGIEKNSTGQQAWRETQISVKLLTLCYRAAHILDESMFFVASFHGFLR